MSLNKLDQAAEAAGIALRFVNARGEKETIREETKAALLAGREALSAAQPA